MAKLVAVFNSDEIKIRECELRENVVTVKSIEIDEDIIKRYVRENCVPSDIYTETELVDDHLEELKMPEA